MNSFFKKVLASTVALVLASSTAVMFKAIPAKAADTTPYVCGDFTNWNVKEALPMAGPNADGLYTLTSVRAFSPGTYKFKVTIGKSWDTCYGINGTTSGMDNNVVFTVTKTQYITFKFDSKTHIPTYTASDTDTTPYICGDFTNSWDNTSALEMVGPDVNNMYTLTPASMFKAGTYNYKVIIDKTWDTSYGADGASTGMSSNVSFTLSKDQYVTFKFDPQTHVPTFTTEDAFPYMPVTPTPANMTIYFKNALNWSNVYCYMYYNNKDNGPKWPGTQMTNLGNGWYSLKYTGTNPIDPVFTDNSGKQTNNCKEMDTSESNIYYVPVDNTATNPLGSSAYNVNIFTDPAGAGYPIVAPSSSQSSSSKASSNGQSSSNNQSSSSSISSASSSGTPAAASSASSVVNPKTGNTIPVAAGSAVIFSAAAILGIIIAKKKSM